VDTNHLGYVHTTKQNWSTSIPEKKKKRKWDDESDNDDTEIPGIPLHNICWNLLEPHVTSIKVNHLFSTLKKYYPQVGNNLESIDYGEILENQGQDYELKDNQQYLLSNPTIFAEIYGLHNNQINQLPGDFAKLALEIMIKISSELTIIDRIRFGRTSKDTMNFIKYEPIWKDWDCDFGEIENGRFQFFDSPSCLKNYHRIQGIIKQIKEKILPSKNEKRKKIKGDNFEEIKAAKLWSRMNLLELKTELKNRGLKVSGNKSELVRRIEEYEEKQ